MQKISRKIFGGNFADVCDPKSLAATFSRTVI